MAARSDAATITTATGTGTSATANVPSSAVAGTLMLAHLVHEGGSGVTPGTPSGWVSINSGNTGGGAGDIKSTVYRKVAGSGEPADYTWTLGGTARQYELHIVPCFGTDGATPIDASVSAQFGAASTSLTLGSLTATRPGGLEMMFTAWEFGTSVTSPGGFTELYDAQTASGSGEITAQASERYLPASGATGTITATGANSVPRVGHHIILRPLVRSIPVTAVLMATKSRAIPATAVLIGTYARAIPVTAVLEGGGTTTFTRDVPVTAVLLATKTRAIPATAVLMATATRAIPVTAVLVRQRSIPVTAVLSLTATRSIPTTAVLMATATRPIPVTAVLIATRSRAIPVTAVLSGGAVETFTRTIPATAVLMATKSRAIPVAAVLMATRRRLIPVTAVLSGGVAPAAIVLPLTSTIASVAGPSSSIVGTRPSSTTTTP